MGGGISIARVSLPAGEHPVIAAEDTFVCVHAGPPVVLHRQDGAGVVRRRFAPGDVYIAPLGCPHAGSARLDGRHDFLLLQLDRRRLAARAAVCGIAADGLRDEVFGPDPILQRLAHELHDEISSPELGTSLLVELLALQVEIQLVRRTAIRPLRVPLAAADPRVRRALERIRDDPGFDHSLADLAQVAGLSRHHLARLFRRATGLSPHRYVLRERLRLARDLVEATSLPLANIAARAGFCDQGHLGRHFRRWYGVAPAALRVRTGRRA